MQNIVEEKLPMCGRNDDELQVMNAPHPDTTKIIEMKYKLSFHLKKKCKSWVLAYSTCKYFPGLLVVFFLNIMNPEITCVIVINK